MHVRYVTSQHKDDKPPLKGAWSVDVAGFDKDLDVSAAACGLHQSQCFSRCFSLLMSIAE